MNDWKLLANQKATLLDLIQNGVLTTKQRDDLQGIVHFIDEEQDFAAGMKHDVVFLTENGYTDKDNKVLGPSEWLPGPNWLELVRNVIDSADDTGCDGLIVVDAEAFSQIQDALEEVSND